ncbi:MAG: hypothetical protein LUC43_05520 [Burkholderiales bacterium]|nr:hypothetical protein [Burkholderiales bacterium]
MNRTLRLFTAITVVLTVTCFSACSYVDQSKKKFSDEDLADKAAASIGVEPSSVSVVPGSVQTTKDQISYRAQDGSGNLYRCYFAVIQGVVGYVTSGSGRANCTKLEGISLPPR